MRGVSRQAIHKLVRGGRVRSITIGGHVLVNREDVEDVRRRAAGRPASDEPRDFERIRGLLESCDESTSEMVYAYLRAKRPPHPIEARLGADSEIILEALGRAGELTTRMFRGVIAEAAFEVHVVRSLKGWRSESIAGNPPFDFRLDDGNGPVHVQVKLQRSAKGSPILRSGCYAVETQRTRGGKRGEQQTRPYRFGEFDILAVCLHPSTGRWDEFRYAVGSRLLPQVGDPNLVATLQPVSPEPNEDWSNQFITCVEWFRSGESKRISGNLGGRRGRQPEDRSN